MKAIKKWENRNYRSRTCRISLRTEPYDAGTGNGDRIY